MEQARDLKLTGGRALKEVVITAKKIVKDSKNVNGPGEADLVIDEEDLKKAGKKTLGDLIRERVKGFQQRGGGERIFHTIGGVRTLLIIDGTLWFFPRPWDEMEIKPGELFKLYLDSYTAEDIKGIEVIISGEYQPWYTLRYVGPKARPFDFTFIEVTTRSGIGPSITKTPGTFLYKPMPFILQKSFYSPKYTSGITPDGTDTRSTIHWAPNVVTDKGGNAKISFSTADHPGSYSLILEGADMRGNVGAERTTIKIKK